MFTSRASVATDAPARYAKQLTSHMSRRIEASWDGSSGRLPFDFGSCALTAVDGALLLEAKAPTADDLARVEEVTGSHLVRFGRRNELVVDWERASD